MINSPRYFLYARKSSESEDRQVASVSSQIEELKKLAREMNLNIIEVFTEEKSAKAPGRPVFSRMIADIHNGKAEGIVCWKLDRLARNPIDGGTISWMLQQSILRHIQTFQRGYFPTDNVLMMNLEFGMANQFILDLSVNTKRGQRSKIQQGWIPHKPPVGYLNNKHNLPDLDPIYPDPYSFQVMKGLWGTLIKTRCSIEELFAKALDVGLKQDKGFKVTRTNFYRLFHNPFYCGDILWDGNTSPGKHKPMISRREFDMAQEIMNGRIHRKPQIHEFAFTGMIRCGECGAAITAEGHTKHQKNGNTHHYTYYRCTRKIKKDCRQPAIKLEELEAQVVKALGKITIPPLFKEWVIKQLKEENVQEIESREDAIRTYRLNLDACSRKINTLLDMRIGNEIPAEDYTAKKDSLMKEKRKYEELVSDTQAGSETWIKRAEDTFSFAVTAQERFKNGSLQDKRQILSCLGLNLLLKDKKLQISVEKCFALIQEAVPKIKSPQNRFEPVSVIGELGAFSGQTKFWGG